MPCFDIRQCSYSYGAWRREREASFSPMRRRHLSRKCAESWMAYPWQLSRGGSVAALGFKNTVARLELLKLGHRIGGSQTSDAEGDIGLELQSAV